MYHAWQAIAGPVIEPMVRRFEEANPGLFIALTGAVPAELGPMTMAPGCGHASQHHMGSFARWSEPMHVMDEYIEQAGYEVDQLYSYLADAYISAAN